MNLPEEPKPEKPISELQYRIIAIILFLIALIASFVVVILELPPASFVYDKLGNSEDTSTIAWFVSFFLFLIIDAIILRIIKPFSNVPNHPLSNLTTGSFFKGDSNQDEYKINKNK